MIVGVGTATTEDPQAVMRALREANAAGGAVAEHATLGRYRLDARDASEWIFTDNETNAARLFGAANRKPHVKDAFHDWLVHGHRSAVNAARSGNRPGSSAGPRQSG